MQLANLFNKYFSQFGSELREQIPNNGRDLLKFFDETDKIYSIFRFYESTPEEVAMLISKFQNEGSPPDMIPTLIYKRCVIS